MMAWPDLTELQKVDLAHVGKLQPVEVLYQFEYPCIYTSFLPSGSLVLAYLAEELEQEGLFRYLLSTTSDATVSALKSGAVSVREALLRGSLWLVDVGVNDLLPVTALRIDADQLPIDALPARGTMLLPELEPALRIRLCGDLIKSGALPAPVLTHAAEIAKTALKPIFEWAARGLRTDPQGRPPEWLRDLYSLQIQAILPGSLEVAMRLPDAIDAKGIGVQAEFDINYDYQQIRSQGWKLLQQGLEWAASDREDDDDLGEAAPAIVESLRRLAPMSSSKGPVTAVEVSGVMLGRHDQTYRLTQEITARLRAIQTKTGKRQQTFLRVFEGRIRSLDLDLLRLILRNSDTAEAEVLCVLEDDRYLEDAKEAYYKELLVKIACRSYDEKNWTVVDLEFETVRS